MSFLDDIERIENAKKSLYNLLAAKGASIDESVKIDEYTSILEDMFATLDSIQYGYIDESGSFQKINLSNQPVVNDGQPMSIEAVLYKLPYQSSSSSADVSSSSSADVSSSSIIDSSSSSSPNVSSSSSADSSSSSGVDTCSIPYCFDEGINICKTCGHPCCTTHTRELNEEIICTQCYYTTHCAYGCVLSGEYATCQSCGLHYCEDHSDAAKMLYCDDCGKYLCVGCSVDHVHNRQYCAVCGSTNVLNYGCDSCGNQYCEEHVSLNQCNCCENRLCDDCVNLCPDCMKLVCKDCLNDHGCAASV